MSDIRTEHSFEQLDVLFLSPPLSNWQHKQQSQNAFRIENFVSNQESPNIGMGYLLAIAKRMGIRAKYIDMPADGYSPEDIQAYVVQHKPTLVGFMAYTPQIKKAAKIAEMIKNVRPATYITCGGPHAKAMPVETLQEYDAFDFIVVGEGEDIFPLLFEALGNEVALAKIKGVVTRGKMDLSFNQLKDLDRLPFPAWEEFDLTKYLGMYPHRTSRELPMLTMRGCPFECTFCCNALGRTLRRRSLDNIMAEIERNIEVFGVESIAFLDETFYLRKDWMLDFCNELIRRGFHKKITWSCSTRVSGTDPELFQMMARAGCYYIFFGLESASDQTLKRIKKGTTVQQQKNSVLWAKQAGIIPVGAFIIGLEGTTAQETLDAIELGKELDLYSITFPLATPFPGSPLRDIALQEPKYGLKILTNDWDLYEKQDCGAMETEAFPLHVRKELQDLAYASHPKKRMDDYMKTLAKYRVSWPNEGVEREVIFSSSLGVAMGNA